VEFAELFIAHLLRRKRRVEDDLIDQLFNSSEKRLARTLLLLANFGKEDKSEPVLTHISQETLAEMIGTTRSRVSFFMNKFRKLGFIDYNGEMHVHNSLLSIVLHD
jgi:CRP-like cAMP-binding protein